MARLIIESGRIEREYWRDLWRYRELFQVLAARDIAVRYKQTVIGVLWALIQPLLTMIILTVIFSKVAKLPSAGIPYPLFVFGGILPWLFVSASLTGASQSLVGNANLIAKVYFPRLIIPAGAIVTAMADFGITFLLLIAAFFWYHFIPPWHIIFLPCFIVLAFFVALGPGLLITALNVKYRDFRYIIPFLTQFGVYISPVGFGSFVFSGKERLLYSLNPMVGVIDGFRWALLGGQNVLYLPGFALSLSTTVAFLWLGVWYFRRMERTFADII
jgi:lipopolysaccharide transport system permease protein